jgi:manganese/zinc/iron transport system ATP- binding protein
VSIVPLEVTNVSVAYGANRVLDDVSFGAPAGCIVGVIGPNGAGKSTLFRAMLGLLPHTGTVRIDGTPAYVPQGDRTAADFPATALDVAVMGTYGTRPWWRPLGRAARDAARQALDDVGMGEHRNCTFGELSGGQRQRVIMARALAHGGKVMLLDEPMTGVDATSGRIMQESMSRLRDRGATLLVATHDLNDAASTCDLLLFLNHAVVAFGPPDATYTAETLRRTYDGILVVSEASGGTIRVLDEGAHHDHAHGGDHADHHHAR